MVIYMNKNRIQKELVRAEGFGYVRDEDRLIVPCSCKNIICEVFVTSGIVRKIYTNDKESLTKAALWGKSKRIRDCVIVPPQRGNDIEILNFKTYDHYDIPIKDEYCDETGMLKFWELFLIDELVYVFGYQIPVIARLDLKKMEITYLTKWIDLIPIDEDFSVRSGGYYIGDGYAEFEDVIYLPLGCAKGILAFDKKTENTKFIPIEGGINQPLSISRFNDNVWITDYDTESGVVTVWNRESKLCKNIIFPEKGQWYAPVFYEERAYLFPVNNDARVYQVDMNSLEFKVYKKLDDLFLKDGMRYANVECVQKEENKVVFIRRPDYTWFTYDFETGTLTNEVYEIQDEESLSAIRKSYYNELYKNVEANGGIFSETDILLEEFMKRI